MKKDITTARWYMKPYYHMWAFAYYAAVRLIGKKFFYYASKPKEMSDIILEIRRGAIT
jgi:hypothetical protein